MGAFEEDYESDEDEYDIVYCTQSTVTDNYKRISNSTAHLFKQDHQMIQVSWLLLDDCSTINIICNPHLVDNIHEVDQRCIITTNAGTGSTNLKATLKSSILPMKEEVLFTYNGIANIIVGIYQIFIVTMRSNNNNLDSMNGHLAWNLITQSHDCESSLIDCNRITEPRPKIYTSDTVSRYTRYSTKTSRQTEPKPKYINEDQRNQNRNT